MWLCNPFDNTCDSQGVKSFASNINGHQTFIINYIYVVAIFFFIVSCSFKNLLK